MLLNNERLLIFLYLLKNPVLLAKLLTKMGGTPPALRNEDVFSVSSLSVNVDSLFDTPRIKALLLHIASKGFLSAAYRKADGFVYTLTKSGEEAANALTGDYFDKIRALIAALEVVKLTPTPSLNAALSDIFRSEGYAI